MTYINVEVEKHSLEITKAHELAGRLFGFHESLCAAGVDKAKSICQGLFNLLISPLVPLRENRDTLVWPSVVERQLHGERGYVSKLQRII